MERSGAKKGERQWIAKERGKELLFLSPSLAPILLLSRSLDDSFDYTHCTNQLHWIPELFTSRVPLFFLTFDGNDDVKILGKKPVMFRKGES